MFRLYAQYTDPKSEEGSKLSPQEKERLLDLLFNELLIFIEEFGRRIPVHMGGFI